MNSTVYKYPIGIFDAVYDMPQGAELLHVASQEDSIANFQIWARVDPDQPTVKRLIHVRGTGHPIHDAADAPHIGTVIVAGGGLVWHIFDGGER